MWAYFMGLSATISYYYYTYNLNNNKKLIVVVAGSLGSKTVNDKMKEFLYKVKNKDYEVLYITGKSQYEEFIDNEKFPNNVKVIPYLDNLPALLKNTDLLIIVSNLSLVNSFSSINSPALLFFISKAL